jgi:hypothetical protein
LRRGANSLKGAIRTDAAPKWPTQGCSPFLGSKNEVCTLIHAVTVSHDISEVSKKTFQKPDGLGATSPAERVGATVET